MRKLFDRIVIGIGNNTAKQGLLTVENRKRLIDDIYAADPRVEARVYTGLTGEFAEAVGACSGTLPVTFKKPGSEYSVTIFQRLLFGGCSLHS